MLPSRFLSLKVGSELVAESMMNMLSKVIAMSHNVGLALAGACKMGYAYQDGGLREAAAT